MDYEVCHLTLFPVSVHTPPLPSLSTSPPIINFDLVHAFILFVFFELCINMLFLAALIY